MPQTGLTPADYGRSVVAVPPLALAPDGGVAVAANRDLMRHIAQGGVTTLLYGGNANLYHFGAALFREAVEVLVAERPAGAELVLSIGPDFGKAMDQAADVLRAGVANVMLLPMIFPADRRGVAEGVRRLADRLGHGLVLYVKRENYVAPDDLARLVESGEVRFVKYAVERPEPASDAYLDSLVAAIGTGHIASGMGETPVIDHIGRRRLVTYTSGAVCIAPAAANEALAACRAGRLAETQRLLEPFLAFERARTRLGGTAVLHDAVTLSGIADCGTLLPLLANLDAPEKAEIRPLIAALQAAEEAACARLAAAA